MSGQQIGTIVGGVVGAFFGMPQLGMVIGGMIGGAIDPEVIKAPGIGDAQRQTTQAGVPRPVVFGHPAPFMGNIIDGEHKARKIIVEEGGKGGPVVESERFILTSAIRICEGPIAGVVRIWRNGEVVADFRADDDFPEYPDSTSAERSKYIGEIRAKTMAFMEHTRIYLGDEDQLPDPALEAIHGVGNTPYYRGTCYMVLEDDDVTDTRGACAQYEFEVVSVGAETQITHVVPTMAPSPSFGLSGGLTAEFLVIEQGDTFASYPGLVVAPVMKITGARDPADTGGAPIRVRARTTENGAFIFDSGWMGDSSFQAELVDTLVANGREDLVLQIAEITSKSAILDFAIAPTSLFIECIRAGVAGGSTSSTVIGTVSLPDQASLPASMTTIGPELPHVIVGGDGEFYVPDFVDPVDLSTITAGSVTLSRVVSSIADRCGVPAAYIDTTALTDIIPGFLVAQQFTGADCIRPTQQMYFYDMPEFDGQIVAVKRGGAAVATLSDDDMLEDGADDEDIRAQAIEFPLKVSVMTRDPAADYNPMPQTSARYSSQVQALGETVIQSPIPFGADEAAQRADIIHRVLWAQAEGRSKFQLPEEWTRLVPSNCFERNGKRWLIESVEYADGAVRVKSVYDRATNYVSNATGIAAPLPVLPTSPLRGPTLLAVMNLPPLREQDNVAGARLAVTGTFSGWGGCTVQMSVDGGATYRTVATISRRSVMGRITGDIGPTSEPIPVSLDDGELSDSTTDRLDLGANAFALVPASGQSEIGQFTTATEGAPDQYAITGTRRGVKGTNATMHASGEQFVMLEHSVFLPIDSSLYGTVLYFRAVTNGTPPENNAAIPFLFEAPTVSISDYLITEAGDYLTTEAEARLILE